MILNPFTVQCIFEFLNLTASNQHIRFVRISLNLFQAKRDERINLLLNNLEKFLMLAPLLYWIILLLGQFFLLDQLPLVVGRSSRSLLRFFLSDLKCVCIWGIFKSRCVSFYSLCICVHWCVSVIIVKVKWHHPHW